MQQLQKTTRKEISSEIAIFSSLPENEELADDDNKTLNRLFDTLIARIEGQIPQDTNAAKCMKDQKQYDDFAEKLYDDCFPNKVIGVKNSIEHDILNPCKEIFQ